MYLGACLSGDGHCGGADSPRLQSQMKAIAALPEVQSTRLPGTLGQAEEYGAAVAETIRPFLAF